MMQNINPMAVWKGVLPRNLLVPLYPLYPVLYPVLVPLDPLDPLDPFNSVLGPLGLKLDDPGGGL